MNMPLSVEANERLYDALALAIDAAGPEREALLLTKLALLLANEIGDEAAVNQAVALAASQLAPPPPAPASLAIPAPAPASR